MSQVETLQSDAPATPGATAQPTVVTKSELRAHLQQLLAFAREYGDILGDNTDSPEWEEQALAMILAASRKDSRENSLLTMYGVTAGFTAFVLQRLQNHSFRFRVPNRLGTLPEVENPELASYSQQFREQSQPFQKLVGDLPALAKLAPAEQREKISLTLSNIGSLFKGLLRQDWDDVAVLIAHLNLVTTSRDNQDLVDQIARIARDIYNSLNEFSQDLSLGALSHSTEEIPDAVVKLRSVITHLEQAANSNLDHLERLSGENTENRQYIRESEHIVAECLQQLENLGQANPHLTESLGQIIQVLNQEVSTKLLAIDKTNEQQTQALLTMMANQGFQDLTGQTLKRVIEFIEALQFQLVALLTKYAGDFQSKAQMQPDQPKPVNKAQNQDEVDQLLGILGF